MLCVIAYSDDLHNTHNNNISLPPAHDHAGGQRRWWKQCAHALICNLSRRGYYTLGNSCRARTWSDLSNSSASSNNNAITALIYIYGAHTHNMLYIIWKTPFHIIYIIVLSAYAFYSPEAYGGADGADWASCMCEIPNMWESTQGARYSSDELLKDKKSLYECTHRPNTKRNLNGFINTLLQLWVGRVLSAQSS